jgi:ABC-type nitrate/sulfonate/bicarbonate transport system substrate-binding protein
MQKATLKQNKDRTVTDTPNPIELICFAGAPNLPIFAAQEKGAFEDSGVTVNLTTTPSSVYQAEHLIDGTFQMAGTAFDNIVAYQEGQGAFKPATPPDLFVFMGATQVQLAFITAPDVKTYPDVKGRKLALDALSTGFAFILYEMLARGGLGPDDYEMVAVGATPKRWESVRDGETAGSLVLQPFTSIAQAQGFNVLETSTTLFESYQGGTFAASRAWAADNADTVKGFIKGYLAGLDWTLDPANRDEAAQLLLAKMPVLKPGVVDAVMDGLLDPKSGLTPKAEVLPDGVKTVLDLRSRHGDGPPLTDPERYFDLSYYNQVVGS